MGKHAATPTMSKKPMHLSLDKVDDQPTYDEEFNGGDDEKKVTVTFHFPEKHTLRRTFSSGETALGMKKVLFDTLEVAYGKMTMKHNGKELIDPLSICDTPELKDKNEFDIQVEVPDFYAEKWQNAKWSE